MLLVTMLQVTMLSAGLDASVFYAVGRNAASHDAVRHDAAVAGCNAAAADCDIVCISSADTKGQLDKELY